MAATLVVLLLVGLLLSAGCQSEQQAKQAQFKEQWTKIMDQFQVQVVKDDQKAQTLANNNDLSSLIKLTKQRIQGIDDVLEEILALYPPPELRKLQGLTVYYLVSLVDRLQAQSDLAVAVFGGKPNQDLQNELNQLVSRNNTVGSELAVELAKDGITLKNQGQQPPSPSTTPTSAPTSTPSTAPKK